MRQLPLIIALLVACAAASPLQTAKQQLGAQYVRLASFFQHHDIDGVLSIRSDDFHAIAPDGTELDRAAMEEYTRNWFDLNKPPVTLHFIIRKITLERDGAMVEVLQHGSRQQSIAGKLHRVDHDVTQQEHWRKTSRGWRLWLVDQVHDQHRWVDGKRIEPEQYDTNAPPDVAPRS